MFKKIKEWFTKKPESVIEPVREMTTRELHAAVFKVVPENYNPVKAAIPPLQPEVVAPLTAEQANVVYTATVTSAPTHFEDPVVKAVDQQAVVEAAEGSATTLTKKPRKSRRTEVPLVADRLAGALASWPFPTDKPSEGSTVTQAELEALKVTPAAMKASKPRKNRPEKALYVPKMD